MTQALPDLPFQIAPPLPHIREYRDEDAEAVSRLWRESASAWPSGGPAGGEHSTPARVRRDQAEMNGIATFIAFAPDPEGGPERAVGYCSLYEYVAAANTAYVGLLSAHPDWHGRGVGRDLLKAALARTVVGGYTRLDLNTWAGNIKAVPLYKKSGYFWEPDTSVHMENYLPLIFRLGPAQRFFRHADWYATIQRNLDLQPDEEKLGKSDVYTYRWEHDGRHLRAVIDRHARALVALETDRFEVAATIDDPRLPVGGRRHARWTVQNKDTAPLGVTILAEGEDSVRCAFQTAATVELSGAWDTTVEAEQPDAPPAPGHPANRVRSTVVLDGEPVPLALSTQVVQPVTVSYDRQHWLTPGIPRDVWLTVENGVDEPAQGTLRLSPAAGLDLDRDTFDFDLGPRRKVSWPLRLTAADPGSYPLRAQATVRHTPAGAPHALELRTRIFERTIHCGEPGELFVDQTEDEVQVATDRLLLTAPLKPGGWQSGGIRVSDRDTGEGILSHSSSLGPPFSPSVFTSSTWTPAIRRDGAGVTLTLTASPPALPGITFDRVLRISPSGLIRVTYRLTNAAAPLPDAPPFEREFEVNAWTVADLQGVRFSQVALPLRDGLVVEDSSGYPDLREPAYATPEWYAESWAAEFGEGRLAATIWTRAKQIMAQWDTPDLYLDLGAVGPGQTAETAPLYLFAGNGDWRTARRLWRQLVAPHAPRRDPEPRPADVVRPERFVFDETSVEVPVRLESARVRTTDGTVALEVAGVSAGTRSVEGLRLDQPRTVSFGATLPPEPRAVPAVLVLDHRRSTERVPAALIRRGVSGTDLQITTERDGEREIVRLDNGYMRLAFVPAQWGRVLALHTRSATGEPGEWVDHLYAAYPEPRPFVWMNPWFGGISPQYQGGGPGGYPGRLRDATFTWREAGQVGSQGLSWHGIAVATTAEARGVEGLRVAVSYLTAPGSNVLAMVARVENGTGARANGSLSLVSYLQPGGDRTNTVLHYERDRERNAKRVHGGSWASSGRWCAVVAAGSPGGRATGRDSRQERDLARTGAVAGGGAIALVAGTPNGHVDGRDFGLEGAHPGVSFPVDLAPGEAMDGTAYLVVAADLDQARLYRHLADAGGLV